MHALTAKYRVATDMFLSRDRRDAELRASSIRGALRFWYRAMMWPKLQDWEKVKEHEARLFGSSHQEIGQSRMLVSVMPERRMEPTRTGTEATDSLAYLGYGVINRNGSRMKLVRDAIPAGTEFTVRVQFRPVRGRAVEQVRAELEQVCGALQALGLFGGLGSRSRNGFGSLNLQSLLYTEQSGSQKSLWQPVNDVSELVDRQRAWTEKYLGELPDGEPDYTAFSKSARIITSLFPEGGMLALEHVGGALGRYRRYPIYKGGRAHANFPDDHDNMYAFAKGDKDQPQAPRRSVFGLPHNYFLRGISGSVNISARSAAGKPIDRRASPLFIHIHDFGPEKTGSAVTFTFLPAKFLPEGAKLSLTAFRGAGRNKELVNRGTTSPPSDWTPIVQFIESNDLWPDREVVLP